MRRFLALCFAVLALSFCIVPAAEAYIYATYSASSSGSVLIFDLAANGNVAPLRTIGGSNAGLNIPYGIAVNSSNIFVVCQGDNSIRIFNLNDSGNVAPVRTISGSNTGLNAPMQVAVDTNYIYVTNYFGNSVTVYNLADSGNVTPVRTLSLSGPVGITIDSSYIYVANNWGQGIVKYNLTASGNATPASTLTGSNTTLSRPQSVTLSGTAMFVGNYGNNSILVFNAADAGNVSPLRTISGAQTGLNSPFGVATDASYLYVGNLLSGVMVYSLSASGNAAPMHAISGGNTGLDSVGGVAVDSLGIVLSDTTTALASNANPSTYGSSVTFTATVAGSSPTGTVTFKDGASTLGTTTLSGGSAGYTSSSLSVGTHSITAVYSGDTNNAASTSPALSQVVNQAPVNLGNGISLTFSQVTDLCSSSASTLNTPPGSLPANCNLISLYDISTCATYTGPITVTIPYNPSLVAGPEANLKLFHWENGAWRNVTVSVDAVNHTITGQVTSLSPFGIGYTLDSYSTGANTNMIAFLAIVTISLGGLMIRKRRTA